MSISHRLICFACEQEQFVRVSQGVMPSWLFTTRLPFQGDGPEGRWYRSGHFSSGPSGTWRKENGI